MPAEGRAELTLAPGDSVHNAALSGGRSARAKAGHGRASWDSPRVAPTIGTKPLVAVDLAAPARPTDRACSSRARRRKWALPIPKPAKPAPAGRAQFSFDLDGLPPGVDPKSPVDLTFTVVTGDRAVEVKTRLD